MPNINRIYFPIFIYYNFSSKSNFTLKFLWWFAMLLKNLMRKWRKSIHEIPIHANFSYICAPNPVRRVDPSGLERFNARRSATGSRDNSKRFFDQSIIFIGRFLVRNSLVLTIIESKNLNGMRFRFSFPRFASKSTSFEKRGWSLLFGRVSCNSHCRKKFELWWY